MAGERVDSRALHSSRAVSSASSASLAISASIWLSSAVCKLLTTTATSFISCAEREPPGPPQRSERSALRANKKGAKAPGTADQHAHQTPARA
eukprot:990747-Pleurochrysis_carterae.AAC.2